MEVFTSTYYNRRNLYPPPYSHAETYEEAFYQNHIKDRYIVRFNEGHRMAPQAVRALTTQFANQQNIEVGSVFDHVLQGFSASMPAARAEALARNPNIHSVVPVAPMHLNTYTQNGPDWGLDRIDQIDLPLSSTYTTNYQGDNVRIYIVDSGVKNSHQEMSGRVTQYFDRYGDSSYIHQSSVTETFCPDGPPPPEDELRRQSILARSHGTHVAGIASGQNYGVAKQAEIYDVRVANCYGHSSTASVISGLNAIRDFNTSNLISVINLSLGATVTEENEVAYEQLEIAINQLTNSNDFIVVASAGNGNADASNTTPARISSVVTVGASNSNDAKASFSNYGAVIDIFAPGESITSATYNSNSSYGTADGTSMAAPFVSGALALLIEENIGLPVVPSDIITSLINHASLNKLYQVPSGTANKLLYIPNDGEDGSSGGGSGGSGGGSGGSGGGFDCPYMDENNNWVMCQ
ncbi:MULTISPECIES: S8 family peptidase [Gammaproteobacteria]|uniref:S8 family peptidase n=1 Tax=Gammaproteobacteria TaxID=1236 RepID=UPI000DD0EC86|nr:MULTISPECIES: S8 family peptidase [Gammaproteobacteria]RTE85565.1 S8 family peptidase [Aliidiomarina sp. B3213]TCZ89535.1 S8 family peptidase [Lysobacter sp. N42]